MTAVEPSAATDDDPYYPVSVSGGDIVVWADDHDTAERLVRLVSQANLSAVVTPRPGGARLVTVGCAHDSLSGETFAEMLLCCYAIAAPDATDRVFRDLRQSADATDRI